MSFQDRQYYGGNQGGFGGMGGGGLSFGLPSLTPMVKYLLIANFAAYILQHLIFKGTFEGLFAVQGGGFYAIQIWRLLTFQFLHASPSHIIFNMLGMFFLGPVLERSWGGQRFLTFYLTCGAVGGLLYSLATILGVLQPGTLIGASGGVLGLMVACAILFPHFQVILLIFPVPIRFACVLFTIMYTLNVISSGPNAGGDLCHLGGMATGFLWLMGRPMMNKKVSEFKAESFQKKQQEQKNLEYEVDRILAKVHSQGIHSLTNREKQILQQATDMQKKNGR